MKKLTLLFLVLLIFAAASYWLPIGGGWLDQISSAAISRKSGTSVRVKGSQLLHWQDFRCQSAEIDLPNLKDAMVKTGLVEIRFSGFFFLPQSKERVLTISDISIPKDLLKNFSFASQAFESPTEESLGIEKIGIFWDASSGAFRIFDFSSTVLRLKGGMVTGGERILKLHLQVYLSQTLAAQLPETISKKLMPREGEWKAFRVLYQNNLLTLSGEKGPFFTASWQA